MKPNKIRIKVVDAAYLAGNQTQLGHHLGMSKQWVCDRNREDCGWINDPYASQVKRIWPQIRVYKA